MDGNQFHALWLGLVQKMSLCGRQLRRALSQLTEPRGLTDHDALILWSCQQAGPLGHAQHEMAAALGISPAQLSGLVETLSDRGWISGRRPSHDRRRQYWRITTSGEAILAALVQDLELWSLQFESSLPPEQRDALDQTLLALTAATARLNSPAQREAA